MERRNSQQSKKPSDVPSLGLKPPTASSSSRPAPTKTGSISGLSANSLAPNSVSMSARSNSSSVSTLKSTQRRGKGDNSSRRGVLDPGVPQHSFAILDPETGENRTPQSLIRDPLKPSVLKDRARDSMNSGATTPTSVSEYSDLNGLASGAMSRRDSHSGSHTGSSTPHSVMSEDDMGQMGDMGWGGDDSDSEAIPRSKDNKEAATEPVSNPSGASAASKPAAVNKLKPEDLESDVIVTLSETATFFVFESLDVAVAQDSSAADGVKARNQTYKELKKAKVGNDKYVERAVQTLNAMKRTKDVQVSPAEVKESGVGVSAWDIFDTYQKIAAEEQAAEEGGHGAAMKGAGSGSAAALPSDIGDDMDDEAAGFVDDLDGGGSDAGGQAESSRSSSRADADGNARVARSNISSFGSLPDALMTIERMIVQNVYGEKQKQYRSVGAVVSSSHEGKEHEDEEEVVHKKRESISALDVPSSVSFEELFTFSCAASQGLNVSCMAWNPHNPDILAVGYGEYDPLNPGKQGMVCCWSLMNPTYPERMFKTPAGVCSVSFSHSHGSLLAVGTVDGSMYIFDIRSRDSKPALHSNASKGKHSGAVWDVQWITRGADRGEQLVSISADGRVAAWSITKGLEHTDLMRLKRVSSSSSSSASSSASRPSAGGAHGGAPAAPSKPDAFISRQSGGLCFDFAQSDSNIYLAGTDDGTIHKCSCSYNEQFLENYFGHTGPVYRVRWSPFSPNYFLSCSDDWTIRLWNHDRDSPVFTFQTTTDAVSDVAWSPFSATVFGSVTSDGRLDVWDLAASTLDPVATLRLEDDCKLNSILFSNNAQVLVAGDNQGRVHVVRYGSASSSASAPSAASSDEERARLESAIRGSQVASS